MPSIAPRLMPESLTESFCERCGTRYAFKAPTTLNPLRKARGLAAGLKNYVMSSDSMSEAVSDAMHDETEAVADRQRQAFDRTFNFCMTCRQYACRNCWNPAVGSCLTCAPTEAVAGAAPVPETAWPDHDVAAAAARLAELTESAAARARDGVSEGRGGSRESTRARVVEDLVWPDALPPIPSAPPLEMPALPSATPPASVEQPALTTGELDLPAVDEAPSLPERAAEAWPDADLLRAEVRPQYVDVGDVAPAEPVAEAPEVAEAVEAADTAEFVEVPDISEAPEIAEITAAADEPLEVAAITEVPEPVEEFHHAAPATRGIEDHLEDTTVESGVVIPFPEAAAEATPEPYQTVEAEAEPRWPELPPQEQVEERIAAVEETPEAVARREQLDVLGLGDPGRGPAPAPERPVVPPLPVLPRVDDPQRWVPREPAPSRVAASGASARDGGVAVASVGVQDCSHCGLSLSASARFCRRCGQRQLRSA